MIRSLTGRCIVFDLDDTLYDEIEFVRSGYAAITDAVPQQCGLECRDLLGKRLETRRFEGAFQEVVRACGLPDDALAFMVETYRAHKPAIQPRDGVVALLAAVKRGGGVVGCITDGRSATQRNKIAALGLDGVLEPVLISEETGHAKPDPHNFRVMMELVEADEFWYVADNPEKDFIAPNALGWTTLGIDAPRGIHRQGAEALLPTHRPRHQLALPDALAFLDRQAIGS